MVMNGVPVSGRSSRESRRRAIEQARQREARRRRRLRLAAWGGAALVLAGTGTGIGIAVSGGGTASAASAAYAALSTLGDLKASPAPGPLGPEKVPVPGAPALAGTSPATAGQAIKGISCDTSEQTLFHVHTHLTIFVNGQQRQGAAAICIPHTGGAPTRPGGFAEPRA